MTVLSLPLISFIKHYMNTSQSRMAVNKTTGYGTRRQVENRNRAERCGHRPHLGKEDGPVLCYRSGEHVSESNRSGLQCYRESMLTFVIRFKC